MQKNIWYPESSWNTDSGGRALFRGFSKPSEIDTIYISSPSKRVPMNMPTEVQTSMDDWFFKRFGVRFRESSLFATGDIHTAHSYAGDRGQIRQLRPKEEFCFCWSPECSDLYNEFEISSHTESVGALMDRLKFQCHKLEEAILSGHEIMLVCSDVEATLIPSS